MPLRPRPFRALRSLVLLALAGAPVQAAEPATVPSPERSVAAIATLRSGLGQALRSALAKGPEAAIDACRLEAPRLAAAAQGEGLRLGRTSHRLRNPRNAPEPWMRPLLEAFERGSLPRARHSVDLGSRGIGTVEPITTKPLCLTCHGDAVDPALRARILELYPEDAAVGFEADSFRGMFWAVEAR